MAKGISNDTRSTSQKKFKPVPEKWGGLCIGALTDVNVSTAEIASDSPMTSFQGMSIPRLNFIFESRLDKPGVKKSHYIHSYLAIEHTPDSIVTGRDGGAWRWEQLTGMVKHILDTYRDNQPLTEEEVAMLTLDFEDEKDGVFVEQPAEVVVAAYRKFFENIVKLFKPEDKAIYLDDKGQPKLIWMKLLLDINGNQVNRGDYGFPGYPGEGVIELYQKDVPPSIAIKLPKGENIVPKATTSAKATTGAAAAAGTATSTAGAPGQEVPDFLQ